MTQVLLRMLFTLLLTLGVGGTTASQDPPPEDPGRPAWAIGTHLATWSQGQLPDIQDNPELSLGPVLITTDAERDRLLNSQPLGPDNDLTQIAAVDLTASVLVVAGYHSCMEHGDVWTDGVVVWWDAQTAAGSEHISCAWAPFTVDVTEVPRSAFSDEIALVTPPWDH